MPKLPLIILFCLLVTGVLIFLTNPSKLLAQSRDNQRIADLTNLKNAIETYINNNASEIAANRNSFCLKCSDGKVYSYDQLTISGFSTTSESKVFVNSTGWVPIDFSKNAKIGLTPLKILPLDPLEQSSLLLSKIPLLSSLISKNKDFVYTFTASSVGKYKLTAKMESSSGLKKAKADGGTLPDRFEIGTDLTLAP